MNCRVVELDALADPDRSAPHNQRLLPGEGDCFILRVVGAVEVRRLGFELGGAGIDHLVDGEDTPFLAKVAHLLGQPVGQGPDICIR